MLSEKGRCLPGPSWKGSAASAVPGHEGVMLVAGRSQEPGEAWFAGLLLAAS